MLNTSAPSLDARRITKIFGEDVHGIVQESRLGKDRRWLEARRGVKAVVPLKGAVESIRIDTDGIGKADLSAA